MPGDPVDQPEAEDRGSKRDRDRETPRARDGAGMGPPAAGHVQHPEPASEYADEWRRNSPESERKQR